MLDNKNVISVTSKSSRDHHHDLVNDVIYKHIFILFTVKPDHKKIRLGFCLYYEYDLNDSIIITFESIRLKIALK